MDADHKPLFFEESFRKFDAASIEAASDPTCTEQIELALLYEDAPAFVELINNLPSHLLDEKLKWIWRKILYCDSGKCLAAVLDGQTKLTPEMPLATSSVSQLHYAAELCAPKITALLLQRGFSADARGDYDRFPSLGILINALPLHVVMTRVRYNLLYFNFKDEPTAVLLAKICHQDFRPPLETLRLIALNTSTREVKREFFNYLKEGKMIEVGALLLVAKSQILAPSSAQGEGEFRSISEIHDFVLHTVSRLKTPFSLAKSNELYEMERTLELLGILHKIGDKLSALLRVDFTQTCLANTSKLLAASLIEDAGFFVKFGCDGYSYPRSKAESYFLKGAIDACENIIRTSDKLPIWVKEAALTGLGVKPGRTSRFTYPFLSKTLPHVKSVSVASPMPNHLPKKTAPFLRMMKRALRRGYLVR